MPGKGSRGGTEKPKNLKGALSRTISYLADFKFIIIPLAFLCIIANVGNLLGPNYAGKAISAASVGVGLVDMDTVYYYAKLMLITYVLSGVTNFAVNVIMMRVGRKVGEKMRQDVFEKLMKLPVKYFDTHLTGDIISRVSYDIDVVSTSLSTDFTSILTSIITVVGSFIMMCSISMPLVLCVLFTIPISIIYTAKMSKKSRPLYSKRSANYGEMNGFCEEMFSGQKTIVAYANEDRVSENFNGVNRNAAEGYKNADSLGMTMGPTIGMISNFGLAAVGMGGSILFMNGIVDLGQISSFVLYCRKFSGPINEIANIANEIVSALAAAERVFTVLDEPEEVADIYGAVELKDVQGEVEASHVDFRYVPNKPIIKDLNFKVEPGQTIAIVGHTGAGKTTIINLLMRFYDIDSGQICVDGKENREYTMRSLRGAYAMVLQDTWLFNGTVFDNIAYGKEDAAMEEVVAAAKAASIHNYIMRLPDGYNTIITEDGSNISKGQKQLLTIARAMLYDTGMLILDEATSNVDTNTEQKVQRAMRKLMEGRTSFVIAHRLSTIQNADLILVLDHGDVVEQGTHQQLMAQKGFYYKLYASQFN